MVPRTPLILVFFLLIGCTQSYSVQEENVSELLQVLSSDEMKGRHAFSPEIKLAEEFIAENFEKAGLGYYSDLNSHYQNFILNETTNTYSNLSLDGIELLSDSYFTLLFDTSAVLTKENAQIKTISEIDSFRDKYREYSNLNEPLLILVDPSKEGIFRRYQRYYSRPTRSIASNSRSTMAFVLTNSSPTDFTVELKGEQTAIELNNMVGVIEGKRTDEFVLFSAHHDHMGIRDEIDGDSIANGANDNATGVSAVIELAHYFSAKPQPERTLVFTTFTAEDIGGFGSQYFLSMIDPERYTAMFNIEMIGKPSITGPNSAWITGYNLSTFGELLSKSTEGTVYEFHPDPYPGENLFFRSDNTLFARQGIPAHTISTTPIDIDINYHTVSDEYHTLNISHVTNTIKAIATAANGIVSGVDTPSRIDTELLRRN